MSMHKNEPPPYEAQPKIWLSRLWQRAAAPLILVCAAILAWTILPTQWAVWFSVAVAAWIAAYRMGCDKIGALLWCLAAGLCLWPLCIVMSGGTSEELARQPPVGLIGVPLVIAAVLRFLWARQTSARGPNAAMIVVAVFTLVIPAMVGSMISRTRQYHADYQQTTEVLVGLHRLAAEVEAFRATRGRLPKDEAEFVAWRGRPMPDPGRYGRASYSLVGDEYMLHSAVQQFWEHGWDFFGYDVYSRGPRSRERIEVEIF
jgi:hypothetical protein